MAKVVLLAVFLAALSGCAALGGINDGSSLAYGYVNDGRLVNAIRLPRDGDGYVIPPVWANRGNNWGTDELVSLIVRAARRVQKEGPDGTTLYVADLSPQRGGPTAWHKSHQTGRDADLIFFALDEQGRPAKPPRDMYRYGDDGWTLPIGKAPRLKFDVARNWLLVRALLDDPAVDVQHMFISAPLRQMLLDHAVALGEPKELVERARLILQQPVDALPHDDHLHVRIYCPLSDRSLGCRDRGPLRWLKKSWKYLEARQLVGRLPEGLMAFASQATFCRILSTTLLALR